jgi:PAS domain S-box-containing protein
MDHDVTDRRMAEKKLQESEELHRKLIASIPDVIIRTDTQGNIVFVNETSFPSWRYTPKEGLYGKNILSFVAPVDQQRAIENLQKMVMKPLGVIEYRLKFGDGIEVDGEINGDVLRDEQGTPYGMVFVMRDISERKQTEQALLESEGRYRSLFLSSPEAIILVGLDGKLMDVNPTAEAISGVSREKLLDRSFKDLEMMQGEAGRLAAQAFAKICQEGKWHPYSFELHRLDGTARWVEVSLSMLKKNGENYAIQILANDITERKINEAKLLQSEEQFRLISENVADLIIVIDIFGHITYASPSYKHIVGDIHLSQDDDWYETVLAEDRLKVKESFREVITTGISKRIDVRMIGTDGKTRYIEAQANPIRANDNNITSVVTVCRDITEQKQMEQQFLRAQRLESLGTLAGGVAHDLNNVLSPILMAILTLKSHTDEKGERILNMLESSALRGTEIVKQILGFARGVEGDRKPLQVRHLIKEMQSIAHATFPKTIVMRNDIANDIWPVIGDATQIQQLLMNLCVNARDAMPNGGTITLSGENKIIDEHDARINIDAKPGRYVMFGVQDTGIGMPAAVLDRIFEPFFTTKEVGKGTGLGLSTVHTIVKSHKGFINVFSEVGKGTTFTFFLPAAETSEQQQSVFFSKERLQGHGELVLVVDDEVAISQITKQTLEMNGYEVIAVSDGAEAIVAYLSRKQDIDVVITDMVMPIMDGQKTIQALRQLNPRVKIIASSGYSNTGSLGVPDDLNVNAFIVKPYSAEKLLETLRDVLSK